MRHFYLRDEFGSPVGCVAWKLNQNQSEIKYAVSICSNHDTFSKKIGRNIAAKRLDLIGKHEAIVPTNRGNIIYPMRDIVKMIASYRPELPKRAVNSAKLWLNHNP